MSDQPADPKPKRPGASGEAAPPPAGPDLLKPDQAAAWLGVSESTLKRIIHAGAIPTHTVGKRRRFRLADLVAYVEATRTFSAPVAPLGAPVPKPVTRAASPIVLSALVAQPGRKFHNPFLEKALKAKA